MAALPQETCGHPTVPLKVKWEQLFVCLVLAWSPSSCPKTRNASCSFSGFLCLSHSLPPSLFAISSSALASPSLITP